MPVFVWSSALSPLLFQIGAVVQNSTVGGLLMALEYDSTWTLLPDHNIYPAGKW